MITESSLSVALALAAVAPVDGVSVVARAAPVTVFPLRVVLARLLTLPGTDDAAHAVPVTLTGGAGGEVPLLVVLGAGVAAGPGPGPRPGQGHGAVGVSVVLAVPGEGARHSALLAGAEPVALAGVTPAAGGVTVTAGAGVVAEAEIGQAAVGLPRALLEMCRPVHALAVWEGGEVGVPVHTHLHVVAPHTHRVGAVCAALPGRAGHWAGRLGVFLAAALLTVVTARHETLPLPALLLAVPVTLVGTAAALAGVQVGADLLGLALRALGGVPGDLDVLQLGTFLLVTAVTAPHTPGRGGQAGLTGALASAHAAAVPLLRQTLLHTRLLAPCLLQPPHLTGPGLHVPDTLDAVPGGETLLPLLQVAALPGTEPHQVILGLSVEPSVDVDTGIVEHRGVTKPVQV